ncbi:MULTISPECIES: sugar porter family MFS transporter [Rhodanobacter]|uniref:D-xylose-proton symporter n=1 Tax=Rhodanobacter denitrificans TaxID=666685 RepID=M4NKH6_9GAMM|nr:MULTISPECIES: sugar porter family MFS transporter [Rhodanobacter]AGG90183.1 MFS transporter, sugar porter family [Rhodanobacter denitrificans]UJJ50280.1 sugar porter family MFS transporter [Rhodanobacter denitrificans]UJM85571.1 sugar porter family MFS transporter [Rhodanobacter denitrificans]UJM92995.1 sugar porter family MFS transporter [Rhodanobacter denitrificans]UJM96525.1 sugar porter family MFS transporter [Rhodanobacter denitrificans]
MSTMDMTGDGLGQRATARVVLISAAAALGGFLFGFDTAVINGAVDAVRGGFALDAAQIGFAVSCALLGSALGAWYAGMLANRFGRVRTMQVAAVLLVASALGSGLVTAVWDLILWRLVGGIGVGVASVIAPTYIAEVSPAHIRGRLGSMQQLAIVLGIFAALLSDAWLAGVAGGAAQPLWFGLAAWRWMFLVATLPALVYGTLVLGVPESPRHLVAKGRLDEARVVLRKVLNMHSETALDNKLRDIEDSLRSEHRPRLRDLCGKTAGLLPVVWIGILLSVFQQFVGINVIFYYSSTLWHSVGFSEADSFTITVVTSIVNVLVTLVAIALVDKIGRKPLLVVGSAGMAITLGLMAWCFSQATGSGATLSLPGATGMVALVAANAYVVFFGVSWGPVVWVLLGEMFPNRIRATALAVAAAAQWLANFAITSTFPALAELGLSFAYGLYAGFALLSLLFVLAGVRETKGIELEDMRA